jgi:hypothetical protein
MRAVTIKQQQQMTKEIEEQLENGRLNYLKVVSDYCYWMDWNKVCSMGRVMKGMSCLMYPKDNNIHTQEGILENGFIFHKIDRYFFFFPFSSGK